MPTNQQARAKATNLGVQRFPQRAPVILSSMCVRPQMLSGHELP